MIVGSRLTFINSLFPGFTCYSTGGFTAIHENIILNAGVHTTPPQVACQGQPLTWKDGRGEGPPPV